ncbi:small RNA 2'-O-methyltransferase, partial [Phenoliferia sp. Uapishka_3]
MVTDVEQLDRELGNLDVATETPRSVAVVAVDDARVTEKPFFFPPLQLARRTAIVETLRKEGIHSLILTPSYVWVLQVGDFGCGSGFLLELLSMPAHSLDDFPSLYPPSPYSTTPSDTFPDQSPRGRKLDVLRSVPRPPAKQSELHLRRLVGVDVNRDSLDVAIRNAIPQQRKAAGESSWERERWEELRIELWAGGLEVYNDALAGLDAIVATEVIEHLQPQALAKFASVVLGVYQARTVIVTTPNHEFNPYFISSSKEEESQNRFADPTGRTNRVFRDSDHQFEWTQEEFQSWAKTVAGENDYRVAFSGVGSLRHYYGRGPIPFPPPSLSAHPALHNSASSLALPTDPSKFFATQIAIFTRQYPNEPERSPRSHRTTPLPFFSPVSSPLAALPKTLPGTPEFADQPILPSPPPKLVHRKSLPIVPHVLMKSTTLYPIPSAGNPERPEKILEEVSKLFVVYFERPNVCLRDVWNQTNVREACGGLIANLVEAIVDSDEGDEWDLKIIPGKVGDLALDIVWKGWK